MVKAGCPQCVKYHYIFSDRMQKTLLQQFHILRGMVSEVLIETKEIKKYLMKNQVERDPTNTSLFHEVGCQFPLNSEEDLNIFEQYLKDDKNFQNAVSINIF